MLDADSLRSPEAQDIRLAAMDLLARREHSRRELRDKLQRRFGQGAATNAMLDVEIDRLAEENLQSDQRFAESFLRQRLGRGYGPLRIRQELRQRGVDEFVVESALATEGCDWCALAARVLERKFGGAPADDLRQKARRSRFLLYRGFAFEHFSELLD